jgi:CMP-N-acetylneuraminic acid synthetase
MKITLVVHIKIVNDFFENNNLYSYKGKSLARLAIEKFLKSEIIDNVYLDTESNELISEFIDLQKKGLKIIKRPIQLTSNRIGANELLIWSLHNVEETDLIIQSFPTSPLLTIKTIDEVIKTFISKHHEKDSFFTCIEKREYQWDQKFEPINFSKKKLPSRKNLDKIYVETQGLYGIYTKSLIKNKNRIGLNPVGIEISKKEAFIVSSKDDLEILEKMDI